MERHRGHVVGLTHAPGLEVYRETGVNQEGGYAKLVRFELQEKLLKIEIWV